MKIGIIGSGQVGQILAKAFYAEGHTVTLGTRNISKEEVVKFKEANPGYRDRNFCRNCKSW
jgi:predicted dinucleotide-binding enzyme